MTGTKTCGGVTALLVLASLAGTACAANTDGSRRNVIWTDTWLLRAGKWEIVTSQDSLLSQPYETPKP